MLCFYTNPQSEDYCKWGASAYRTAISVDKGRHCARLLCDLVRQFILDRTILPVNPYGDWNESMLVDEDLANEINIYLQSLGPEISGGKLMEFINDDEALRARHGIDKKITLRTAQRYLNALSYRFRAPLKGQYVDGHEREDVVFYREQTFLPQWRQLSERMFNWAEGDLPEFGPHPSGRRVIAWFHDESVFYAHDRRKKGWYHKDAPAKPYAKGEGASLMIADFVSADFGWLRSPDGKQSARRMMKPGKNRDGYFSSDDILRQARDAMMILKQYYPEYDHILIYDNASTHLKRPDDSLSARKMPKGPSKRDTTWGVEINARDKVTNEIIYQRNGKPAKTKIPMGDALFLDGTPQPLYFPEGHERAGAFKGMQIILEERGFTGVSSLRAECKGFKCPTKMDPSNPCCCRRLLYNQPDFANVEALLQTACRLEGVALLFLPKFHCELNFIEQCWGYAKRIYRLNPESSREDHLERNTLSALDAVPLKSMRKFANRSRRFMDAYERGLNGQQAAWAARKYRGHRVLPPEIMEELDRVGMVQRVL
ncbi:hypothetical protein BDN70DRAFT_859047 [Pholiota conissans]|uniref:Uncharacterized protein n=1 Tax=Pholiota conissans TaxID=109636 RepID=A0A9P5Z3A5_9AGAR|nr:hypothetical protein BDN70DRAFT_859047 [Pholiota conissans]